MSKPRLLTAAESAARLGISLSRFRGLRREGRALRWLLPAGKSGASALFRPSDIDAAARQLRRAAAQAEKAKAEKGKKSPPPKKPRAGKP